MTRSLLIAGAAALALFAGTPAGFAQSDPAALQLIERLRPQPGGQTRGIRVPAPDLTKTTAPPGTAAISLTVTFASGSAGLGPEAGRVLDNLGRALGSARLASYRFRVEGHTDTVGPAAMNQVLSERRAAAVRDFLIRRHGVDPARIEAVGLGETQLLVATQDETAEPRNRRVQVVNLGG